jgi:hypothetical protein
MKLKACAPNYRYVTRVINEFKQEPTGICYILREKMRKFEEHSPCRNCIIRKASITYSYLLYIFFFLF